MADRRRSHLRLRGRRPSYSKSWLRLWLSDNQTRNLRQNESLRRDDLLLHERRNERLDDTLLLHESENLSENESERRHDTLLDDEHESLNDERLLLRLHDGLLHLLDGLKLDLRPRPDWHYQSRNDWCRVSNMCWWRI